MSWLKKKKKNSHRSQEGLGNHPFLAALANRPLLVVTPLFLRAVSILAMLETRTPLLEKVARKKKTERRREEGQEIES